MLLSVDPGTKRTGWVISDIESLKPVECGIEENPYDEDFREWLDSIHPKTHVVLEKPVCMRFSGSDISETAILTGHLASALRHCRVTLITRSKVKGQLCPRGNDSKIKDRLHAMFTPGEPNLGKGTKKKPGWFYGFKGDIWQAYALGVVYAKMVIRNSAADRKYLQAGRLF
jgi:hypothetical protein